MSIRNNNNNVDTYKTLSTDIDLGKNVITSLSTYDIGQSVIIQNSRVIAIEAAEGTDNMVVSPSHKRYSRERVLFGHANLCVSGLTYCVPSLAAFFM